VLDTPFYEKWPRQYDLTLITSGTCGICTFSWLVIGLVKLLNGFQWLAGGFAQAGDWGLAIILLVALVRTLLHPITKMSQVQMMKMAKMGPELQKLKEKHGDDKEAYTKAQVALMKEQGMAPILGCLPMFLQMPIWIALWQALQSTFELRQASFLWGWTWIKDLSRPDYLIQFDREIPLFFGWHITGINLLPLLMAAIFYIQATIQNKLQPKGTPEQETQKKMMKWMSTFLFPLFLYNGPSGLNLYILTSTLVGIIESKRIRDHIKEREAREKAAAPVVVDARPTRAARRAGRDRPEVEPAKPKTGIMGFIERLQARAEEMRKEQERKGGGGGRGKR
jgi:YidC/Oxa1 family membrane protein insertase